MSSLVGTGISIVASQPLWVGVDAVQDGLEGIVDALDFESVAFGGFKSARMSAQMRPEELLAWLQNGLGRHIDISSHTLTKAWEGFVDRITVEIGGAQITVGPLTNIINRMAVVYQTVQYNTQPPIGGQRARLAAANNTNSQAVYGIQEGTLSGGTGTAAEMAELQSIFLAERAWAETSHAISFGKGQAPTVTIECLGYNELLKKYYYTNTANYGTVNAHTFIQTVLAADPNSLYSDYSGLESNTIQISEYADEDKPAANLIQDTVARGDASNNRWLFGVYEDRRPIYAVAPTTIEYYLYMRDNGQWIETPDGARVMPWDVRPGKWLFVPDLLPVVPPADSLRQDVRAVFIESVRYSAPWGLSINGGKTNKADQKLAKLGLGGTAV